jgi:GR25 family glycosyltransferase involved in LPS biosynthesis
LAADWSFFDKVYCISLDTREDRRRDAMAQFAKVGLADKVEFIIVRKHPTNCEQGIYESHIRCMESGLVSGAENILIFEDDIVFERFTPGLLREIVRFLRENRAWQVLLLGCMVKKSFTTSSPAIVRIDFRSLTHAYAIPRSFAETMVRHHPTNDVAFDDFLRDLDSPQVYAVYPSFAFQSNSLSDNDHYLPLDRFRRLCGGLRSIQKWNEFYYRHKWLIIGSHILVLLAAFLWLKAF